MNKKIDSGKIINEIYFDISDLETIKTLKIKNFFHLLFNS
jgi:methionyl-tRNA formyltransferase